MSVVIALALFVAAKLIGRWYYDPALWAIAGIVMRFLRSDLAECGTRKPGDLRRVEPE